jgi:hypothetical protein
VVEEEWEAARAKVAVVAAAVWEDHSLAVLVAPVYVRNVVIVNRMGEVYPARR